MNENEVKVLIETEQRSKFNAKQIQEIRQDVKELREGQNAIFELASSVKLIAERIEGVRSDVSDVKASQDKMSEELTNVKNRPAQEVANIFKKIKVGIITAICTALGMGIFYAAVSFMK